MSLDDEDERLLGHSRRKDQDAVRIQKPSGGQSITQLVKGVPQPRNTLKTSPYFPPAHEHRKSSAKHAPEDVHRSNVRRRATRGSLYQPPSSEPSIDYPFCAPNPHKRRKIEEPSETPPDSVISIESSLDELPPEDVRFKRKASDSQEKCVQPVGSRPISMGSRIGLTEEYRKVEAVINSRPGSGRETAMARSLASNSQQMDESNDTLNKRRRIGPSPVSRDNSRILGLKGQMNKRLPNGEQENGNEKKASNLVNSVQQGLAQSDYTRIPQSSLNSAFRTTEGKTRGVATEDRRSPSPDELERPATLGPNADVVPISPNKRARSDSPRKSMSPDKRLQVTQALVEPSRIKPTIFQSGKKARKKYKRASDFDSDGEEAASPWCVAVAAVNIPGEKDITEMQGTELVEDAENGLFYLRQGENRFTLTARNVIEPKKLQKCIWEKDGRMARFEHSQNQYNDRVLDLVLTSERNLMALLSRLQQKTNISIKPETRSRMMRMFEMRREEGRKSQIWPQIQENQPDDVRMAILNQERRAQREREGQRNHPNDHHPRLLDELKARGQALSTQRTNPRPTETRQVTTSADFLQTESQGGPISKPSIERHLVHNSHLRRSARRSVAPLQALGGLPDLSPEPVVQRFSKIHGLGKPWLKPLSFPKTGKKRATVEFGDLERLDEGQYLNDNLISFYLRKLEHELEMKDPYTAKRVYFFNTFFYERLTSLQKGQKGLNYEGVQKWTRAVDLFAYDFVIVPINESTHWYVAVISNLSALGRKVAIPEDSGPQQKSEIVAPEDIIGDRSRKLSQEQDMESPERETTNSFAEMTLENKPPKSEEESNLRSSQLQDIDAESKEDIDDSDMLDVPASNVLKKVAPNTSLKATPHSLKEPDDPIEDFHEVEVKPASRKPQKRKPAPIMSRNPNLPTIITFDSLDNAHGQTVKILKQYLVEEGKAKRGGMEFDEGQIRGITAKGIPGQSNFSDCGLFMLGYVEKMLSTDPREFIAKIIKREYDLERDWPDMVPSKMRADIRDQLLKLHETERSEKRTNVAKTDKSGEKKSENVMEDVVKPTPPADHEPTSEGAEKETNAVSKDEQPLSTKAQDATVTSRAGNDEVNENVSIEPHKPTPPTRLEPFDISQKSLIVVDSESQVEQVEELPTSQPLLGSSQTLEETRQRDGENEGKSSPVAVEIPESQSPPQQVHSPRRGRSRAAQSGPTSLLQTVPQFQTRITEAIVLEEKPIRESKLSFAERRRTRPVPQKKPLDIPGQQSSASAAPKITPAKSAATVIDLD